MSITAVEQYRHPTQPIHMYANAVHTVQSETDFTRENVDCFE